MRNKITVLWMLTSSVLSLATPAAAQVSIGISLPGVSIGINLPVYPQLVPVPGYPVYYAPQVSSNYFFYDGMYWVYQRDSWYASSWYNGPWGVVAPQAVPLFVLRVPVRYYRQPPAYFRGWRPDAPPRWADYWGNEWAQRRGGWDTWDRRAVPAPAPLPAYQRQYSGNQYPRVEQQQALQGRNYRYQPRDALVREHYQAQRTQRAHDSSAQGNRGSAQQSSFPRQDQRATGRPSPPQQGAQPAPRGQPSQRRGGDDQRPAAARAPRQQEASTAQNQMQRPSQRSAEREQASESRGRDKGPQGKGHGRDQKQDRERGRQQGEQRDGTRNN